MRRVSGKYPPSVLLTIVLAGVMASTGGGGNPDRPANARENADELPSWRIVNICQSDSAVGQCKLYEAVARQRIASSWTMIPAAWREQCLRQFTPPLEPSWRILSECIGGYAKRSLETGIGNAQKASRAYTLRMKVEDEAARKRAIALAEEKVKRLAEAAEAEREAEEEAQRLAAAAEAERRAEEEAQRLAAAAEAERRAEEDAIRATELAEAKRKAEEEVKRLAEAAETERKAAEEAKRLADAADAERKAEEEAKRLAEAAEAKRLADAAEVARKKIQAAAAARRAAEDARLTEGARVCRNTIRSIIARDPITFASSRSHVRKYARQQLDEIVAVAKGCPTLVFRIEGHTDSTGSAGFNQRLSKERAQAVVRHLTNGGISANRIFAVGYGETLPVASNATRMGRRKNRRIEFHVE